MAGATVQGFLLGAGLIVAIGAQNAFVLRQGLRREHVFVTAAICFACDAVLIVLGVAGLGAVISASRALRMVAAVGGAVFLGYYGLRSFRSAAGGADPQGLVGVDGPAVRRTAAVTALALSLLNPHVYLDTVVLIGSVGAQYDPGGRSFFAAGAALASLVWFFGIGYGAGLLSGWFRSRRTWRWLDTVIGCVMWTVAVLLVVQFAG
jgi:L-lysine exporter family protein LysE/ArgO